MRDWGLVEGPPQRLEFLARTGPSPARPIPPKPPRPANPADTFAPMPRWSAILFEGFLLPAGGREKRQRIVPGRSRDPATHRPSRYVRWQGRFVPSSRKKILNGPAPWRIEDRSRQRAGCAGLQLSFHVRRQCCGRCYTPSELPETPWLPAPAVSSALRSRTWIPLAAL